MSTHVATVTCQCKPYRGFNCTMCWKEPEKPASRLAESGSVWVTLGNGIELGITADNQLIMRQAFVGKVIEQIVLGKASKKRIEELQSHLERLKCHCE